MSFDEQRRAGEAERRRIAAERSAARGAAGPSTTPVPSADAVTGVALHAAIGGGILGLGALVAVFGAPLLGGVAALAGVGVIGRGVVRFLRRPDASFPAARPSGLDPRVVAAYDRAREAIDGSSSLGEERRLELLAALRGGLDEIQRVEAERPQLVAAVAHLPGDGGGEAGVRLHAALDRLDANRDQFIAQCAQLQATLATLPLTADRAGALAELTRVTSSLGHEAEADRELTEALAAGRRVPEGR